MPPHDGRRCTAPPRTRPRSVPNTAIRVLAWETAVVTVTGAATRAQVRALLSVGCGRLRCRITPHAPRPPRESHCHASAATNHCRARPPCPLPSQACDAVAFLRARVSAAVALLADAKRQQRAGGGVQAAAASSAAAAAAAAAALSGDEGAGGGADISDDGTGGDDGDDASDARGEGAGEGGGDGELDGGDDDEEAGER